VICTVLYILIALVLTGMVSYTELKVTDPLAFVFNRVHQRWIGYIISASAVVATTSVLLLSARPAADLDEHEPGRPVAEGFCEDPP